MDTNDFRRGFLVWLLVAAAGGACSSRTGLRAFDAGLPDASIAAEPGNTTTGGSGGGALGGQEASGGSGGGALGGQGPAASGGFGGGSVLGGANDDGPPARDGASGGVGGNSGSGGAVTPGGTQAKAGTGGSGGGSSGGTVACSDAQPCGGGLVGTWTVTSSCLKVAGQVDLTIVGLGCPAATVTGSRQVTGTWTATSNGRYTDKTVTSGNDVLSLPATCLRVSGTVITCEALSVPVMILGYNDATCGNGAGGGCTCSATVKQTGGMGIPSYDPSPSGTYTTSGSVITLDDGTEQSYCVSGNTMTWIPRGTNPPMTGAIVLQKQ